MEETIGPGREARTIYHLQQAVAELGLAHALTDSRQVQQGALTRARDSGGGRLAGPGSHNDFLWLESDSSKG